MDNRRAGLESVLFALTARPWFPRKNPAHVFRGKNRARVAGPGDDLRAELVHPFIVTDRFSAGFDIFDHALELGQVPIEGRSLTTDLVRRKGLGLFEQLVERTIKILRVIVLGQFQKQGPIFCDLTLID